MAQKINHLLNRKDCFFLGLILLVSVQLACKTNIVDSNVEFPDRKWTYRNQLRSNFEITDNTKAYNIYFKLRHTDNYRYANIFVLAHFKEDKKKVTKRYQFKLSENDGEWLGSGSGNLFTHTLPLLRNYRFEKNGKYEIDIEQNMRDNPLMEISDAGILVEETDPR